MDKYKNLCYIKIKATPHKDPSTYVSMPSEFLYNLTKNLTAHLRHYLCAVLP